MVLSCSEKNPSLILISVWLLVTEINDKRIMSHNEYFYLEFPMQLSCILSLLTSDYIILVVVI